VGRLKSTVQGMLGTFGYCVSRIGPAPTADPAPTPSYDADGLVTYNKNIGFLRDPRFLSAYRRGMNSGHAIGRQRGDDTDIHIEWRIAVCCWAAQHGSHLAGDFVECGVNTGIMSLAVCEYVDFNRLEKSFYLFDTFQGIPIDQASAQERHIAKGHNDTDYFDCYQTTQLNFAPFSCAKLIRGIVPDTLATVNIDRVAYLSIDMNIAYPERAAIEYFWPKLSPGAVVVVDDYAWRGCDEQKNALDEFAHSVGVEFLTLPTGQGILIRP
jgi:O-methyltransferase